MTYVRDHTGLLHIVKRRDWSWTSTECGQVIAAPPLRKDPPAWERRCPECEKGGREP